ncbi:MAG: hypothetical protein AAGF72_08065, partial [Pseudomonadota bacterium]
MNHVNHATDPVSNNKRCLELVTTSADWQIREDRSFYVPDFLSDKNDDTDPRTYTAAKEHAAHLHKAEGLLCDTKDLVELMRAAISDEHDARAMQADTALAVIEEKLREARLCIDEHDRHHTNLFLAYFELKG